MSRAPHRDEYGDNDFGVLEVGVAAQVDEERVEKLFDDVAGRVRNEGDGEAVDDGLLFQVPRQASLVVHHYLRCEAWAP